MAWMRLTILLVPVVLKLSAAGLAAQSFELGGSVAVSCIGSDGSVCSEGNLLTGSNALERALSARVLHQVQGNKSEAHGGSD